MHSHARTQEPSETAPNEHEGPKTPQFGMMDLQQRNEVISRLNSEKTHDTDGVLFYS